MDDTEVIAARSGLNGHILGSYQWQWATHKNLPVCALNTLILGSYRAERA